MLLELVKQLNCWPSGLTKCTPYAELEDMKSGLEALHVTALDNLAAKHAEQLKTIEAASLEKEAAAQEQLTSAAAKAKADMKVIVRTRSLANS